ncbi:helix-turn-helix domain-containing protein [Streptomyces mirabilis]|uniref:helix-turn-helix domain-containing protein n=1 Tax=Streptomyces mirabilis TaxID=68239 RepID=UPI0033AD14C9
MRGMSKRALAQAMDFDPSYVSHMESGRHKPGGDFARRSPTPCSIRNAHDAPLLDQLSLRCAISHRSPVALLRRRSANGFGTHEAGQLREHASRRFKSCRGHRTQASPGGTPSQAGPSPFQAPCHMRAAPIPDRRGHYGTRP